MKKKSLLLAAFMAGALFCNAQQINPLTRAVINSYTEMISQNPRDYMSYFQRGSEYFNLGEYAKAEEDLLNAIKYTPAKETADLDKEYTLLSDIYIQLGNNDKALEILQTALSVEPNSYVNRYKLGNLFLALDRPEDAYKTFQALQSLKSRSQEAYFGMGQAAAKLGKTQEVEDLIDQIRNSDQNSYLTYLRMGILQEALGRNERAATDYIKAYTMTDNSSNPIEAIVNLANKDYKAVANALDNAISLAPRSANMRFIKASLANVHGDFEAAIRECKELLKLEDGNSAFVYDLLAQSELFSGDITSATIDINKAAEMDPDDLDVLQTRMMILMTTDPATAASVADKALSINNSNPYVLMSAAKAYYMAKNAQKALDALNTAIMTDPTNVEAVVLRGEVNANLLKNADQATADYNRAGNIDAQNPYDLICKAIAKAKAGKVMDAESIIADLLKNNPDADTTYLIAAYYAQTGNLDKAKQLADEAMSKGYNNIFNIQYLNAPLLNLQPIHDRF